MEPPPRTPIRTLRATSGSIVLCALLALVSGCTSSYRSRQPEHPTSRAAPPSGATETANVWSHLFLFGFVRSVQTDVRDVCPSGAAERFRLGATPLTTLISIVTLGLYTPIEQTYACTAPSNAQRGAGP